MAVDFIRFECQRGCTRCCEGRGYVYLTEEDLEKIAARLEMSKDEFERRYVYRTKRLLRLRRPRGSSCPFLVNGVGCSIHPVKPAQCRLYPFWPELVETPAAWRREARNCPGINTGPLIQIGTAIETANQMRQAYPALY
jgi:Fe-S-cluster containining protein